MDTSKLKNHSSLKTQSKPEAVYKGKNPPSASSKRKHKKQRKPLYVVTERQFKTRKKTYNISRIEKTEIRKNLIFFLPISLLSLLFTYKFWDYLYVDEIVFILATSIFVGIASLFLGTLYIYSKALGEPAAFGFIPVLRRVRNQIDDYMLDLEENTDFVKGIENDD